MPTPHEFIEVLHRRWCVRCDLFQQHNKQGKFPEPRYECQRRYNPFQKEPHDDGKLRELQVLSGQPE